MKRADIPVSRLGRNLERAEFQKHVRAIGTHVIVKIENCALVAETLVAAWASSVYPKLDIGSVRKSMHFALKPQIQDFLNWLSCKPILESAYWISSAYSIWVGDQHRKSYAMYFTPPVLTNRMLDDLERAGLSFDNNSFFDPACGGAAFLVPIAFRMKTALKASGKTSVEILQHVEQNLRGTDLDPVLCKLSRSFLRMVLANEIISTGYDLKLKISTCDALSRNTKIRAKFDVVVCNPPYRKLSGAEVIQYRENFADVMQNQPNLYCLFISLCLKMTKDDGFVSLVTPMSFLSGKSFSRLRQKLLHDSQIQQISVVDKRTEVFLGVEQETVLTLLKRSGKIKKAAKPTRIVEICEDGHGKEIGESILPDDGRSWAIPREGFDVELIALASRSSYRLKDFGYTARIGAFVWNRDMRKTYFTVEEARAKSAVNPVPLLWASDVNNGAHACFIPGMKRLHEPAFVDIADANHPSIIKRPAALLQRVTSNDQPQRLIAASVPPCIMDEFGGFIGENHVVILEANDHNPVVSPEALVRLLSSPLIDRNFRCLSGATNVSIYELLQLPLPSPRKLAEFISEGLLFEDAVRNAYRFSTSETA